MKGLLGETIVELGFCSEAEVLAGRRRGRRHRPGHAAAYFQISRVMAQYS